jgi:hypothetical protein
MASEARPPDILAPPRSRATERRSQALANPPAGVPHLETILFSTAQSLIHINPPTGDRNWTRALPDGFASDGHFTGRCGQLTVSGMLSVQTVQTVTRDRARRAVMSIFDPHQCTLRRQRCCIPGRADSSFWVSRGPPLGRSGCANVGGAPPRDQKPTGAAAQTTMVDNTASRSGLIFEPLSSAVLVSLVWQFEKAV